MARRAKDHQEAELKFELDRRSARKIRRHPLLADSSRQDRSQTSQYFDTAKGKVRKSGYSLRVREEGDTHTQTVKSRGGAGLFDRGEWQAPVDDLKIDSRALRRTPLGKVKKLAKRLEPQVRTEIQRANWLIDRDGSLIEVALDSGTVSAEGESEGFRELEFELKAGDSATLFALAREIGQDVPLEIGVLGKEDRGRMLGRHALDHAQKARRPGLGDDQNVGQAFAAIVQECIRHFRLNQALIIAERDPEALHQARVAMRRLRTAFSLFRPAIRQGSLEPLKSELRQFLKPFGTARNLDVFLGKHGEELGWRDRRTLTKARSETYDQVVDALQSQRSREMMVDLVEWTASDHWQKATAADPIGKFGDRRLNRAWKAIKRDASKLGDLPEKRLHRLRIDIKELRYSIEFLAPLYRKKKVRKFAASLEAMQDCLGLIHDDMISREIIAEYGLAETGRTDVSRRSRQLRKMAGRFKRLKKVGAFWR
jgi:inorganic triphosphatase YgiF